MTWSRRSNHNQATFIDCPLLWKGGLKAASVDGFSPKHTHIQITPAIAKKTKTRLSSALEKAKERYFANKRRKTEVTQSEATGSPKVEEVIQTEAPLPAGAFPLNDASLPNGTHQVGSSESA